MRYNNIEISKMNINDFNEISNCLLTDFDDFWTPSVLENEILNNDSYYIVAKLQNANLENNTLTLQKETLDTNISTQIVGFAGIKIILDEADIMNIVTKKNKRNLGIASALLKNLINIAKEKNINKLTLEVNYKNLTAIHLYEKFGFIKIAIRKKYYNNIDDAIIMQLNLTTL